MMNLIRMIFFKHEIEIWPKCFPKSAKYEIVFSLLFIDFQKCFQREWFSESRGAECFILINLTQAGKRYFGGKISFSVGLQCSFWSHYREELFSPHCMERPQKEHCSYLASMTSTRIVNHYHKVSVIILNIFLSVKLESGLSFYTELMRVNLSSNNLHSLGRWFSQFSSPLWTCLLTISTVLEGDFHPFHPFQSVGKQFS